MGSAFEPFDMEAQVIYSPNYNFLPSTRLLLRALLLSLKNLLFENNMLVTRNNEVEMESKALREEILSLRDQIMTLNAEYCRSLTQAREELLLNRLEEQETPAPQRRLEEKERREL